MEVFLTLIIHYQLHGIAKFHNTQKFTSIERGVHPEWWSLKTIDGERGVHPMVVIKDYRWRGRSSP